MIRKYEQSVSNLMVLRVISKTSKNMRLSSFLSYRMILKIWQFGTFLVFSLILLRRKTT